MPSTSRATSAYAAHALLFIALSATGTMALPSMTAKGCYSSSQGLSNKGPYTYQTSGYCQGVCTKTNQAVLAVSQGSQCWCGDELPPASALVDDSKCNTPCNGYATENCGGDGFFSVYLTGTNDNPPVAGGSSGGSTGGSTTSSPSQTTAQPSVVTTIQGPGKTVVITTSAPSASSPASSSPTPQKSSGGPNVAGIAAGVVVGVVVLAALIAGLFFFLRHRRQREVEEEYKRTQVADFMRGGSGKAPGTGYSNMSDSRLDPEAGARRNSHGSIADDQDYSRRILRVANPDRS